MPTDFRQRWADGLLGLGGAVVLAGMFLTPPWMFLGLGLLALGALLAGHRVDRSPGFVWGCAFGAWILLSVGWAAAAGAPGATGRIPTPAFAWILTPLVALAVSDPRRRTWALRALLLAAGLAVILAACQWTIGLGRRGPWRIDPAGDHFATARGFSALHLTFGYAGALTLALASLPAGALGAGRAVGWGLRALAVVAVGICGSRAAQVGAVAGIFTALATRGRRWMLGGLAVALVLAGALTARMWLTDGGRLRAMLAGEDGRWPIWRTAVLDIREQPLLGTGGRDAFQAGYPAAFALANPGASSEFPEGAPHAHNTQLALAAEYGLPAPILHLGFLGAVLLACWRRRKESPAAWQLAGGVVAVTLAAGLFEPYPTQAVPGLAGAAVLGVALGLQRQSSTSVDTVPTSRTDSSTSPS